jgi:hypothetical protein
MAEPCRPQPTTGVWAGSSPHRRRGLRAPFGTKHYLRLHRQVHGWSLLCMHSSGELKPRSSAANWVKASSSRRNSNCRSREGQTEGLPGRTEVAAPARLWTPTTLAARRLRCLGHHGMEEVRGSSPLSSTRSFSWPALNHIFVTAFVRHEQPLRAARPHGPSRRSPPQPEPENGC